RGLAADIDDLQRCYFGNHWSLVTPGLEPQAGVLIITGKEGETFTATLEKVGGHNGQQIVARGRGTVKDDGTLRWVGHVFAEDGTTELIRVAFRGVLSVTGKAIGGGTFSARGAFPDGFEINDHSFYQWETPCPFTLPPPQ
ncbi:MAG: hypothetical protein QOD06_3503, partial [Candidatus Binatota bacterium]|nr:hypothetical protein [Candidatus Binatota bacterium]